MITKEDRIELGRAKSVFKKQLFSREELNFILRKKLTDKDYQIYVDSESRKEAVSYTHLTLPTKRIV